MFRGIEAAEIAGLFAAISITRGVQQPFLNLQPNGLPLEGRHPWREAKQMAAHALVLVLATVNAPYSRKLDAQGLAHCLTDPTAAEAASGPMSSFFGEVEPALQIDFAGQFNITEAQLAAAAKAFATYSGQSYPLAA
jgi:hypothetical protein